MVAIRPPCLLQRQIYDDETCPSGLAKKRGPRRKGKKKSTMTRHVSPPEGTNGGSIDDTMQSVPPAPPLRTPWPHAHSDPVNLAPEEDDPELPDEPMQAGNVEPNRGPLLHC